MKYEVVLSNFISSKKISLIIGVMEQEIRKAKVYLNGLYMHSFCIYSLIQVNSEFQSFIAK